ncbi:MAG: cation:proton antiporter [Cytophagales bacterium]|nr:cation:proton antiporter [Cytophagales bacterium]
MEALNAYTEAIAISLVVIISYIFSAISKKTGIPSVLLLILLGFGAQQFLLKIEVDLSELIMEALELLGIIGLIMIVLEAALDLKLEKEKRPILVKSLIVALLSLVLTALAIAQTLHYFVIDDFYKAMMYAVPLSILSSAIIIPSVAGLVPIKKEFMIYESTFSDILGIMFFYFLIGSADSETTGEVVGEVSGSILITVALSLIISYGMVLLLQNLQSKVKLFFLISVLVLLYAVGKMFHLSSLLIIMVFGLVLNNSELFFKGRLKSLLKKESLTRILEDFHIVTMESAFVVRTFFFVIFGMTLDFSGLSDLTAIYISLAILAITFSIRYAMLKGIVRKNIFPIVWIAPRGLITILLFFSIPATFQDENFNSSILLIVILATSFIMSGALIGNKEDLEEKDELNFEDWEELDKEIAELTKE